MPRTTDRTANIARLLADVIRPATETAAGTTAGRHGMTHKRDDIASETFTRVATLLEAGREPFDDLPALSEPRIRAFVKGVAVNVAREMLRKERRSRDYLTSGRAEVCADLAVAQPKAAKRVELDDTIRSTFAKLDALAEDARETLVAEEVMQHGHQFDAIGKLCSACNVSRERVAAMIEARTSGQWSADAWRQRVHRARKKARALITAAATTAALLLALAGAALVARASAPTDAAPATARSTQNGSGGAGRNHDAPGTDGRRGDAAEVRETLAKRSTQNGKRTIAAPQPLRVAKSKNDSTQNGRMA